MGAFALLVASPSLAAERALEVELRVHDNPQIAIWLEDSSGRFVDTIMVTKLVGTFGLGNRPGRQDFGAGFLWPYGRRENALPIWAHRRGVEYDRLVFQDCKEGWLGWHETYSSAEPFYCRPTTPPENDGVDAITCPTTRFNTDKGKPVRLIDRNASADCAAVAALPQKTLYPPRNDIANVDRNRDWSGVGDFQTINDLDAVTRATPAPNVTYRVGYQLPAAMAPGEYTIWVEVNLEYDMNAHHDYGFFVDPQLRDYGQTAAGQPSLVWKVPITIGEEPTEAQVLDYTGYGDPHGASGTVNPPDATITTNLPGSGAQRLIALSNAAGQYRVRVLYNPDAPCVSPEPVGALTVMGADYSYVDIGFVTQPTASMYETRYAEGPNAIVDDTTFMNAVPGPAIIPSEPGMAMTFRIDDLRPRSLYTVAVRSYDRCRQASTISSISVETPDRIFATVDACFIATAAYGSKEEPQVRELRAFRDRVLMRSELGRAFVDTYYGVSPPIADVVREHDSLRFVIRTLLGPVVSAVRDVE